MGASFSVSKINVRSQSSRPVELKHLEPPSDPPPAAPEPQDSSPLHIEVKGVLVDALHKEIRSDVIEKIHSKWLEEIKIEVRKELLQELLDSLRKDLREEVAEAIKRIPPAVFAPNGPRGALGSQASPAAWEDSITPKRNASMFDMSRGGAKPGYAGTASLIREATGHNECTADRVPLILFTDMGGAAHDCGDTVALFLLRGLEGLGFLDVKGVIVSGNDSRKLEMSVKTITTLLGHLHFNEDVGVGVCLQDAFTELPDAYKKASNVDLAETVLEHLLEQAEDRSLVLVITCINTTLASFLQRYGELISQKVKHVSIFGTVCDRMGEDILVSATARNDRESSYLKPDPSHQPFAVDMKTTDYVFRRLQDLGVMIIVSSRFTVYAGRVRASLYDDLAWTNNAIARRLRTQQHQAVQDLWDRVHQPVGSPARGGLPARCTPSWFAETMCGGKLPQSHQDVWSCVTSFFMYDAVTIVAAIPILRERIFSQNEVHHYHCINEKTNLVYGQSNELCGVADKKKLANLLHDASLAGLSISPEPYPIIIFTDPGQDLDDELALVMLAALTERKYVRPIAVVANLHPSLERACLAKGTLRKLGLDDVPVAVGTDGGCTSHKDVFSDTAFAYLGQEDEVEKDADALLRRVLMGEEHESVIVLCISSLTDAAKFLKGNESLFVDKVHSVTIMGGVDLSTKDEVLAEEARQDTESSPRPVKETFKPDTANNNTFDMPSAIFLYTRLQELNIKTNVLTRFAAYGCPLPRNIYDTMQKTGSPIALRLFDVQRKSIEELWKRCNASGDERRGLPARCSKEWYTKTFLGGRGSERSASDSIWDLVVQFNMYDPMALLLAVPPLAWVFFDDSSSRSRINQSSLQLRVIGTSPEHTGIKHSQTLRDFLMQNLLEGVSRPLRNDSSISKRTKTPLKKQDTTSLQQQELKKQNSGLLYL
ncbi:hypothetical protein AB1Y20_021889 [Prymnesium parvum]|uniref:Inosine/uridine-preferring nucleoside hydrolase domain-containing protein n=1 Tax=Prymnesium parvum TaxID=97485 RepID=A0AB34JHQ9_PRYPA